MKNKFKDYNTNLIINDYINKIPLKEICIRHDISSAMIYKLLDKDGLKRKGGVRKYFFDEHFFDIIDTEAKAYYLGWFYADGNNYTKLWACSIKLQEEDGYILEKLSKIISNGVVPIRSIKRKKGKDQKIIKLSSKILSKSLYEKGVVDKKSLILKFPTEEQIPSHFIHHFIRGYFDGDGCISSYKAKKSNTASLFFTLVGSEEFLKSCQETLENFIDIKPNKILFVNGIYKMSHGGNPICNKIKDWLYQDATIFLERKHKKFYNKLN